MCRFPQVQPPWDPAHQGHIAELHGHVLGEVQEAHHVGVKQTDKVAHPKSA